MCDVHVSMNKNKRERERNLHKSRWQANKYWTAFIWKCVCGIVRSHDLLEPSSLLHSFMNAMAEIYDYLTVYCILYRVEDSARSVAYASLSLSLSFCLCGYCEQI